MTRAPIHEEAIMKRLQKRTLLLCILVGAPSAVSFAQSNGASFAIPRQTVDSGGGRSNGTNFTMTGTVGQADANFSSGSTFQVRGGFWGVASGGPVNNVDDLFKNGFE
jgi:hypothetical protein